MAKQPTPQGISALLRKAGFDKSESHSTAIRGWSEHSEGFKVSKGYPTGVEVEWRPHSLRFRSATAEQQAEKLAAYTKVLEAAGWVVRQSGTGFSTSLIVSAPEED